MTVRQLLASLDSDELTEWMAYDRIETIGETRADLRAGIIAATVANFGSRELNQPARPSDFMAFLHRGREPDTSPILLDDPEAQSALILSEVFQRKVA